MKGTSWKSGIVLEVLMMTSSGLLESTIASAMEEEPRIVVSLYNYAQVPDETLIEAEAVVTRIFERAGIPVSWEDNYSRAAEPRTVASPGSDSK